MYLYQGATTMPERGTRLQARTPSIRRIRGQPTGRWTGGWHQPEVSTNGWSTWTIMVEPSCNTA